MRINYKKILNLRKLASEPKKLFALLIFVLVILFIQNYMTLNSSFEAKVLRVIDGDTIEVLYNDERLRIRFFGIDAPELKQEFGVQAKEALSKILNSKMVEISYKNKDIYGRIVGVVKLKNTDINKLLVAKGFAWADTYYTSVYVNEQIKAQKNKLGLWQGKNPIEPYKWRKNNKF